jgi:hypothetical protein
MVKRKRSPPVRISETVHTGAKMTRKPSNDFNWTVILMSPGDSHARRDLQSIMNMYTQMLMHINKTAEMLRIVT